MTLEATATWSPPRPQEKLLPCWRALRQQPRLEVQFDLFSGFLFSEAVGSPRWNGVALQDTKLGAGGRFLGTGSREI